MFWKKGQTATEYLIILAVVIIIALITVGVLGGLPSLSGSTDARTSATYWSTADIGINSYAVSASTNATFVFKNNLRNSVTLNSVKVKTGNNADTTVLSTASKLGTGKTVTASYNLTAAAGGNGCATAGDSFAYVVTMNYTDSVTGATYTFNGDGNQLKGTCAN